MIASALRVEIERYAARMRRSNPLFSKAEDRTLTAACLTAYLANIRHLVSQTPVLLARARARALALGDTHLADHYALKFGEEEDHDAWAERDIERMSSGTTTPANRDISPSIHRLVAYLTETIDEDPCLYLAYILFAEYLTVILGPEWLRLLEERCGIPRSSMTVIANHVELDQEHVEEALDCIDQLVGQPDKLPRMRRVLLETITCFERFCVEVTEKRTHDPRLPEASLHVSAA